MRRQLLAGLRVLVTMTVLLGLAYPLVVTGIAQVVFPHEADGAIVEFEGEPVASDLIGQTFEGDQWFHSRPSAAGGGYDAMASSGSNLGPTNPELATEVAARVAAYRAENDLPAQVAVPVDAVTASASGLDPHISVANARLQAPRVAASRGLELDRVLDLVDEHTDGRPLAVLGDPGVDVVTLNLALRTLGS